MKNIVLSTLALVAVFGCSSPAPRSDKGLDWNVSTDVEFSHNTMVIREDGLWVDISVNCYPRGIPTEISCKQSTDDYQRIIATMKNAGFKSEKITGESWNEPLRSDVAYQVRISPNMGGALSYSAYTPHPGLNATFSNSMEVTDLSKLPANLARLHALLKQATDSIQGRDADADMVKISA